MFERWKMKLRGRCKADQPTGHETGAASKAAAALREAIRALDLDKVGKLLDKTPGLLDARQDNGWAPLHIAALFNHAPLASLILERGGNASVTMDNGYTPLHLIAGLAPHIVSALVTNVGREADTEQGKCWKHLKLGGSPGLPELPELLLAHGANVNATDRAGVTPLSIACLLGNNRVKDLLRSRGARHERTDEYHIVRGFVQTLLSYGEPAGEAVRKFPLTYLVPRGRIE
jgi:ankyrin repeat protein